MSHAYSFMTMILKSVYANSCSAKWGEKKKKEKGKRKEGEIFIGSSQE